MYRKIMTSAACEGEDKCVQDLGGRGLKERDSVEDIGVTGRIIVILSSECLTPGHRLD
jgi:hypothetical protein